MALNHRQPGPWLSWPLIFLIGLAVLTLTLISLGVFDHKGLP